MWKGVNRCRHGPVIVPWLLLAAFQHINTYSCMEAVQMHGHTGSEKNTTLSYVHSTQALPAEGVTKQTCQHIPPCL